MSSLGERLRIARRKGEPDEVSQAELGKLVGITQQSVQSIEAGKSQGTKHLVKIAKALGVRPEWLQTGEGPRYASGGELPEPEPDGDDLVAQLWTTLSDIYPPGQTSDVERARRIRDGVSRLRALVREYAGARPRDRTSR